jgi:uncharacterized protein (UPF0332 family)
MQVLEKTSLTPVEQRVLARAIRTLTDELDGALYAVWLYGSRARGEPPGDEDSDVDLMVITDRGPDDDKRVSSAVKRAAEEEGADPWPFHAIAQSPEWVAERRAIEAFLLKEIDRDKVVLAGSGGEEWRHEPLEVDGVHAAVRARTREYLALAHQKLGTSRMALETGDRASAVSLAYYVAFNAARACLSEADLFARTHPGTWHLFHHTFVASGRFDSELAARARAIEEPRLAADYYAVSPAEDDTEQIVGDAKRFLAAVEELLGIKPDDEESEPDDS